MHTAWIEKHFPILCNIISKNNHKYFKILSLIAKKSRKYNSFFSIAYCTISTYFVWVCVPAINSMSTAFDRKYTFVNPINYCYFFIFNIVFQCHDIFKKYSSLSAMYENTFCTCTRAVVRPNTKLNIVNAILIQISVVKFRGTQ